MTQSQCTGSNLNDLNASRNTVSVICCRKAVVVHLLPEQRGVVIHHGHHDALLRPIVFDFVPPTIYDDDLPTRSQKRCRSKIAIKHDDTPARSCQRCLRSPGRHVVGGGSATADSGCRRCAYRKLLALADAGTANLARCWLPERPGASTPPRCCAGSRATAPLTAAPWSYRLVRKVGKVGHRMHHRLFRRELPAKLAKKQAARRQPTTRITVR